MICIEDNFFEDVNQFFHVLGDVSLLEKTDDDYWQGSRSKNLLDTNREAYDFVESVLLNKFPLLKGKKFDMEMYVHVRADGYVNPHYDHSDYNCVVYLSGVSSQFNGTGFYTKLDEKNMFLNATVGFQPNRAVFFEGSKVHACINALSEDEQIKQGRYTLNMFIYLEKDHE